MACTPLTEAQIIDELKYKNANYIPSPIAPYFKSSESVASNFYSKLAALYYVNQFSFVRNTYYTASLDDLKTKYSTFVNQKFPNIFQNIDITLNPFTSNGTKLNGLLKGSSIFTSDAAINQNTVDISTFTTFLSTYNPSLPTPLVSKQQYVALLELYIKQLNDEYCYYYSIYKFGLKALLNDIVYYTNNTQPSGAIADAQKYVLRMNRRCGYLLYCMEKIKNKLETDSTQITTIAENDEQEIQSATAEIIRQNQMLQQNDLNSDVYKNMVTYTYEKNKYSSNILALYGGLNIVAIALLVYIYRS